MNPVLTGSTSLRRYFPFFRDCYDCDIDLWVPEGESYTKNSSLEDILYIPKEIYEKISQESFLSYDGYIIPSPSHLLTIKLSHMSWDIVWYKHYIDVIFMQNSGIEVDFDLFKSLKSFFRKKHGDKVSLSLRKDKKSFFTDEVNYIIDHDKLHEAVAGKDSEPAYKRLLLNDNEVMINRDKFKELSLEEKIQLFQEEITTIAIERWLIPENGIATYSISCAFFLSIKKVITNLTKGWATDFILFNLNKFKPQIHLFQNAAKVYDIIKIADFTEQIDKNNSDLLKILNNFLERENKLICNSITNKLDTKVGLENAVKYIYNESQIVDNNERLKLNYEIIKYNDGFISKVNQFIIDRFPETHSEVIFRIDDSFYKLSGLIKRRLSSDVISNIEIRQVKPVTKLVNIYI